jgi:hypothetical protein
MVVLILGALNIRNKYSSAQDGQTIRSLKDSNSAFETENKVLKTTIESNAKEAALLAQKAEILEQHVTQAPQINELAVQLATQHKELMEAFTTQSSNIGKMAKELGNVAKAVVKSTQDV